MSTAESPVPVLIVGAGPTGLACATLLAQRGVRSLVVERHRDVYPLPRAVHLDDEILRILQQIGVADAFTALSRPALGMRLLDGRMNTIAEFRRDRPIGAHGWPEANLFDQPDLERLLRANLAHHHQAELLGGAEVEHIDPGDATRPAQVRIRLLDGGRTRTVSARTVLGCDGANSMVRSVIGATMRDLRFTEQWLVVDVRCTRELGAWDGVHQVCDPRRAATFMRIGPDRYRWEFRMRPGETAEELTSPETLGRLLAPWTGGIPMEDLDVVRSASYVFRARVADRWRAGRLFLLGDAAHLTPPFIGQGMGAGIRDAANLAWKLAAAGADPIGHDAFLDTYESERRPHATRMIRLAVAVGWAMTGGQDRGAALRRRLLAGVVGLPSVGSRLSRSPSIRLKPGPLVISKGRGRRGPAGTYLPQPLVTVDGVGHRLDDLIGTGYTLVTRTPPSAGLHRLAASLDATIVQAGPRAIEIIYPGGHRRIGTDSTLATWLHQAKVTAAVVRPDRVVLATARPSSRTSRISRTSPPSGPRADRWTALLPPR